MCRSLLTFVRGSHTVRKSLRGVEEREREEAKREEENRMTGVRLSGDETSENIIKEEWGFEFPLLIWNSKFIVS